MQQLHFWFPAYPDLKNAVGGIKQIHRTAECLTALGHKATIVQEDPDFHPSWFDSSVQTISKYSWLNDVSIPVVNNFIVLPETYLPVLNKYFPDVKKIIFNQNAAYTFGLDRSSYWIPSGVINAYKSSSIVQIWSVSQHDYNFFTAGFRLPSSKVKLIVNGIETDKICLPLNQPKNAKLYLCLEKTLLTRQ